MEKLNAVTLRNQLWETLNDVKTNRMDPATADAVASQSREILRSFKTQLQILAHAKKNVTVDMLQFAGETHE